MNKTARNLTLLGAGLSVSAVVGWLLLREARRDSDTGTVLIRSTNRAHNSAEMSNIVLPPEALNATEQDSALPDELNEPVTAGSDDLTLIKDIGPRFSEALNAIGITTYAQLAEQDAETLTDRLSAYVTIRPGRIQDKNWIGQAAQLAPK